MVRKNVTYNQPLEKEIGFSKAVRINNIIAVTGIAPISEDGSVASPKDVYGQAKRCLEIIKNVVEQAGGKLDDVIRTRIFLTDMKTWKDACDKEEKDEIETFNKRLNRLKDLHKKAQSVLNFI